MARTANAIQQQAAPDPASHDRWLLMRLLSAGRASPIAADRLIREFGSIGGVFAASAERLAQLGADAAAVSIIGLVRETMGAVLQRSAADRPMVESAAALADAMHAEMAHLPVEQFRVAFFDSANRLLRVEVMTTGSIRSAHVYPREIARRALELSAAAVVLVHNHPSGDPSPSADDVDVTRAVARALKAVDVHLHDHLVIARRGHSSLRAMKLL